MVEEVVVDVWSESIDEMRMSGADGRGSGCEDVWKESIDEMWMS